MYEQQYNEEESKQSSKFNDAGLSISRLHESWLKCNHYFTEGQFSKWKFQLDAIWLELYPDVLRKGGTIQKELIKRNKVLRAKIGLSKSKNELSQNLYERHAFLREVQDLSGKGGVYVDEDDELAE